MIPSCLENDGIVILSEAKDLPQLRASHKVISVTSVSIVRFLAQLGMTF
jgi:hypothetical protein